MTEFLDLRSSDNSAQSKHHDPLVEREICIRDTLWYMFRLLARLAAGDVEELLAILPQLLNLAISEPTSAHGIGKVLGPTLSDAICDLCATSSLRVVVLAYLWLNAIGGASTNIDEARTQRAVVLLRRVESSFVTMRLCNESGEGLQQPHNCSI